MLLICYLKAPSLVAFVAIAACDRATQMLLIGMTGRPCPQLFFCCS
ncbi:hypothetical protein [Nostoc sp. CHAB 5715]|nr:hypothetical protein [Nostoc sp. CHAB 5715]MCC5620718.1 hypothetical protein [Nostoc sp. CHAB 5715]